MDWTRRFMQLATLAVIILGGYILYGLFFGAVGQWSSVSAADQARVFKNIQGAIMYLNISLGILLLTLTILFYDEEALGYTLVALAIFAYYGMPFLLEFALSDQVAAWTSTKNVAAMAILAEFRTAGIMMAVPGGILLLRDIFMRIVHGARRRRDEFSTMQYGGSVHEETPPKGAPIGMMAKCWQMSFCRDAIRKRCPIYHARTRCWKERVGCMCEENVIRHAMDAIINKEIIRFDTKPADVPLTESAKTTPADDIIAFESEFAKSAASAAAVAESVESTQSELEKTEEISKPEVYIPPSRKEVKIPHNPHLSDFVKRERCRNCVIYNEHQRLKYQFLAPLFVLAVPALVFWKIDVINSALNAALSRLDRVMSQLSLQAGGGSGTGVFQSITSTSLVAQYLILGCLVVIVTTMALRALEWAVFKLKI
jgi:hypothetical protein